MSDMFPKQLAIIFITFFALVIISNASEFNYESGDRDKALIEAKAMYCGECKDDEVRSSLESYKQCHKELFPDFNIEAEKIAQENQDIEICGEKLLKHAEEEFESIPTDVKEKFTNECLNKLPDDLSKCI